MGNFPAAHDKIRIDIKGRKVLGTFNGWNIPMLKKAIRAWLYCQQNCILQLNVYLLGYLLKNCPNHYFVGKSEDMFKNVGIY
jgi:hypothetical protein